MTPARIETAVDERQYVAFISYSHEDRAAARWLHRALENFRIPEHLRRSDCDSTPAPDRLAPIFLDREELSSSADLGESVRVALQHSRFLIVVCSPSAARSRWVNEEVRGFKSLGGSRNILCLVVSGEPNAEHRRLAPDLECLPPSLRIESGSLDALEERAPEPLAADIRPGSDSRRNALLKLAAGLLGTSLDELRQRDQARRQRRLALVSAVTTLGCVGFAVLAATAWQARNEAERQRAIAIQKSLTAERTSQFMISLFHVADPSESRGNSITAREILDRGARQIEESLGEEPQVRAELLTSLGNVYQGLGLYDSSYGLLSKARAIPDQQLGEWIRETTSLADLEMQRGNSAESHSLLADVERRYQASGLHDATTEAQVLLLYGGASATAGESEAAVKYFQRALGIGNSHGYKDVSVQAVEGLAMAYFNAGNITEAEKSYETALQMRIALSGESHPKAAESLNGLAATAYARGDRQGAEANWNKLAEMERRLLGLRHPELAATLNNLGRARLERRAFGSAISVLEESVAIKSRQQTETVPDMPFVLSNLALAHMGLHHYSQAAPLLDRALKVAVANDHPLQGPILMYQADVACRMGRSALGLSRLAEARPKIAARYPDDAWRLALADNVQANCLTARGRYRQAAALIGSSTPVILKKWPANTSFGHDALANGVRLFQLNGDAAKLADYQQRLQ